METRHALATKKDIVIETIDNNKIVDVNKTIIATNPAIVNRTAIPKKNTVENNNVTECTAYRRVIGNKAFIR